MALACSLALPRRVPNTGKWLTASKGSKKSSLVRFPAIAGFNKIHGTISRFIVNELTVHGRIESKRDPTQKRITNDQQTAYLTN